MAKCKKAKKKQNKNRQSAPVTMVDDKWIGPLKVSKTELQSIRELYKVAIEIYHYRINGAQAITNDVMKSPTVPHLKLGDEFRCMAEKAFGRASDEDSELPLSLEDSLNVLEGSNRDETAALCVYIASGPMMHDMNGDELSRYERASQAFTLASFSTDELLLYIFKAGIQVVLATAHAKIDAIIESARSGKARSILGGDKSIVSSWIANLAGIVAGNCHGTMRPLNNLLLQYLGQEVDVEDEILNHPFTISLTGNLLNDIYSNAAVRASESMDLDTTIDLAEKLLLLNLKQFFNSADSNFRDWAFLPPLPIFTAPSAEGTADIIENAESDTAIEYYFTTMRPSFGAKTIIPQTTLGDIPQSPQHFLSFALDNPCDTLVFYKHDGGNGLGDISSDCFLKWQPSLEDWRQNRSTKMQMIDATMGDVGKAFNGVNFNYLIAKKDSPVFEHQFDVEDYTAEQYGHNIHLAADTVDAIANERAVYKLLKENIAERKKGAKGASAAIREREQKVSQSLKEAEAKGSELNEQNQILRRKNQRLMERVDFLEGSLSKAEKKTEQTETKAQHTSLEVSSLMQELNSLREALLNVDKKDEDCSEANDMDTSIFNDLRIVCCGGHESWAKEMRTLHPNVKIYSGSDTQVDEKVLRNADVIWLITNAISHPSFYRITSEATRYHIPVRYFRFWGHRQCKQQLITETRAMFA